MDPAPRFVVRAEPVGRDLALASGLVALIRVVPYALVAGLCGAGAAWALGARVLPSLFACGAAVFCLLGAALWRGTFLKYRAAAESTEWRFHEEVLELVRGGDETFLLELERIDAVDVQARYDRDRPGLGRIRFRLKPGPDVPLGLRGIPNVLDAEVTAQRIRDLLPR